MPNVVPYLSFTNLKTNTAYAHSVAGDILPGWVVDRVGDAPCHVSFEIAMLGALGTALVAATGGPDLTGPITPLLGAFSLDGGASYDVRFVLTSCQRSMDPTHPVLTIHQDDASALLGVTGVDRVTYIEARPADVLNGAPGTIARPKGAIGTNKTWPYVKGLDKVTLGLGAWAGQSLLQMTFLADPALGGDPLSVDIYADTLANALKTIALRLAGTWHPTDTAPFGSRGHWVSHTGDANRNPIGVKNCVSVGRVATKTRLTFNVDAQGPWDETIGVTFASTGMTVEPLLDQLYSQGEFIGGISNHGIDNGQASSGGPATSILCGVVINTQRGVKSVLFDDNLPILGTTAGVYYHLVGSGTLIPMSQRMVANAIAYDVAGSTLSVATPTGVFRGSAAVPAYKTNKGGQVITPSWPLLGGLTAPVEDVWPDPTTSPTTILARCGGSTKKNGMGIDGIYCYPALAGDTSGTGQGYAGWSRIHHSGAPLAAGGTRAHLYYTDRNKPGTVYHIQPGSSADPIPVIGIAAGQNVIGIDTGINLDGTSNGFVYVRTDAGANGLYCVAIGSNTATSAGGGLASNTGAVVQVRRITGYGALLQGEYVGLLAATDAGLFRTKNTQGNGWSSPNAASGLGDFDISFAVAGGAQTVLGQPTTRIFAGAERSFLVSCNAGDNWKELLSEKLDKGPSWYDRARRCNGGQWPDNTVGALGTVPGGGSGGIILPAGGGATPIPVTGNLSPSGPTDTGGTGRVLPTTALSAKEQMPSGFLRCRRRDEQGQFTFRTANLNSQAPMAGIQFHELSELQADADVGVLTASDQVELVEFRWLMSASIPRFQIRVPGSFTKDNAKLRDTCFGDLEAVRYNPAGWTSVLALNTNLYVTQHTMTGKAGYVETVTVLSNTLDGQPIDPSAEAAAQEDRISKRNRFGSA